jgi:hypothetical protein
MNILRLSTLSLTLAIAVITFGYMNVASAGKPDCSEGGDHPSCKDALGGGGYSVIFMGDLTGGSSENWLGDSKGVGLNDAGVHDGVGMFLVSTDLPFFASEFYGDDDNSGALCFPGEEHGDFVYEEDYLLHQAQIKEGKKGRAEATFWFHGLTAEVTNPTRVLYALTLYGDFDETKPWPPVDDEHVILMKKGWKMIVENEGKAIKDVSCIDKIEGDDVIDVTITVTKVE